MATRIIGEIPRPKGAALRLTIAANGVEVRHWSPICAASPHLSPTKEGLFIQVEEIPVLIAHLDEARKATVAAKGGAE